MMVSVFSTALALGAAVSMAFLGGLSFLALREYLSMVPTRSADRPALLCAYAAIPLAYLCVAAGRYDLFVMIVPVYALVCVTPVLVLAGGPDGLLRAVGALSWGLLVTVFALGHLAALIYLPESSRHDGAGAGLLLYLLVVVQAGDVAQYLAGKAFGRLRLAPRHSPSKTWEGLIGGLIVTSALGAALATWLTPFDTVQGLLVGLVLGAGGTLGDLVMSGLKRDLGLKDTGTLLPGHGGVLDRVDSLVLTAPLFFHIVINVQN